MSFFKCKCALNFFDDSLVSLSLLISLHCSYHFETWYGRER